MTDITFGPSKNEYTKKFKPASPNKSGFNAKAPVTSMPVANESDIERSGHIIPRVKPGSKLEDAIHAAMMAKAALTPRGLRA